MGTIGLGDELQLDLSSWSLGYWIRVGHQGQRIASRAIDAVFAWLNERASKQSSKWPSIRTTDRGSPRPAPSAAVGEAPLDDFVGIDSAAAPSLTTFTSSKLEAARREPHVVDRGHRRCPSPSLAAGASNTKQGPLRLNGRRAAECIVAFSHRILWRLGSAHRSAVTVFVIQDQLEHPDARRALLDLAARCGPLLTFASHGSHRAWGPGLKTLLALRPR